MSDKDRMARAICSAWPKSPDGCAALCMDRLGTFPPEGCKHAPTVHGARAEAVLGGRPPALARYRHLKRGSVYGLVCDDARFQFSADRNIETSLANIDLAVYADEETGKYFVRPAFEFKDGRFMELKTRSSLEETFEAMQSEDRLRELRLLGRQIRKFLGGALCTACGEPLGEEGEIVMDDDGQTIHKACEREGADDQD